MLTMKDIRDAHKELEDLFNVETKYVGPFTVKVSKLIPPGMMIIQTKEECHLLVNIGEEDDNVYTQQKEQE